MTDTITLGRRGLLGGAAGLVFGFAFTGPDGAAAQSVPPAGAPAGAATLNAYQPVEEVVVQRGGSGSKLTAMAAV